LIANNILVGNKLVSPAIETNEISIKDYTGEVVASVDASGSARFAGDVEARRAQFSGNVNIGQTLTAKDASFSGQLIADSVRVKKLQAEQIQGLEGIFARLDSSDARLATMSAQYVNVVNNIYEATNSASSLTDFTATESGILSDLTANWPITNPESDVKIEGNIKILGVTSLAQTIIAGPLSQDGTLIVDNGNSINVIGGTLYLQNQATGGIDLLAGKVTIDTAGNAVFEGNLTIKGTLYVNLIKPAGDGDITFDLSSPIASSSGFGKILAKGSSGENVFSLDASGSAKFSGEVAASSFKIAREALAAEPDVNGIVMATASAGMAKIIAGNKEVTIKSPFVTEKSLIYLTPIGSTDNKVLYLARTKPNEQTFTAAIDTILTKDVLFSWWIVN